MQLKNGYSTPHLHVAWSDVKIEVLTTLPLPLSHIYCMPAASVVSLEVSRKISS